MIPSSAFFRGATPIPDPTAYILSQRDGPADGQRVEIWGLSPAERLRRSLLLAGCPQVQQVGIDGPLAAPGSGSLILCRADAVLDHRLVQGLVAARNTVLLAPLNGPGPGAPVAAHVAAELLAETLFLLQGSATQAPRGVPPGLRSASPEELAPAYVAALRKSERPYVFFPVSAADVPEIEDHLFTAAYKGATDLVTKWLWPAPAAAVTRALARRRVSPNSVTATSWLLAILAALLFYRGAYGAGLVAAWLMTFLDTVDGKLARCTLTSSRFGHLFDHGLDLLHPPFWWLAWGLGLPAGFELATAVTVGGYLVGRLLEGLFLLAFKIETHSWRPLDSMFRTVTARRNPNLLLFSVATAGGRPDLGMVMVALWTLASLGFHGVRLAQAWARSRRGQAILPWDGGCPEALRPSPGGLRNGGGAR